MLNYHAYPHDSPPYDSFSDAAAPRRVAPGLAQPAILACIGVIATFILGFTVQNSAFDLPVTQFFNRELTGGWRSAVDGIYQTLRGSYMPFFVTAAMLILMLITRRVIRPLLAGVTVLISWTGVLVVKAIIARPRPVWDYLANPPSTHPSDLSFPSGHTTIVTVVSVVVFLLVYRGLDPTKLRSHASVTTLVVTALIGACCVIIIAITVFTRGVHFPTDSLGAAMWSLSITPFVWACCENLLHWLLDSGLLSRWISDSPIHAAESDLK